MIILSWLFGSSLKDVPKERRGFSNDFRSIVERHGLWGHVELRKDWHPPVCRFILFRITENEEDRTLSLPSELVEEVKEIIWYYFENKARRIFGNQPEFLITQGKTIAEIKKAQQEWSYYCENFWIGAGG
ncbi:MAG: hypothetical protein AAB972_00170 [Patescibacteria group bacterium]